MTLRTRFAAVFLLLSLYTAFMLSTNHRLTVLDDEAMIVMLANNSFHVTLNAFLTGSGQHEHPPLSDFFLHAWLIATHHELAWVRAFSVLFYIAGLLVLAECGKKLGGPRTYWAVLLFGTLWPFGYFYARIAGWYCFCFFVVAVLLYIYLRLLRQPSRFNWTCFTSGAVLLLWTNYYGIGILLVLLGDFILLRRSHLRTSIFPLVLSIVVISLSFLPLLRALLADAHSTIKTASVPPLVSLAKIAYSLFALLASVAVAPWFLPWSLPIAIAGIVLLGLLLSEATSRRFIVAFLLLIAGLALADHLDLKRLIFLTPWLMLAVALACTRPTRIPAYLAIAAVSFIFLFGWIGIATGRHRATSNFYEPWSQVAATTAAKAVQGSTIVGDSIPYFYYLDGELGFQGLPAYRGVYLGDAYRRRGVSVFRYTLPSQYRASNEVIFVQGVDHENAVRAMSVTRGRLSASCRLVASQRSTPDPAIDFKEHLGPSIPVLPYRVTVEDFSCPDGVP